MRLKQKDGGAGFSLVELLLVAALGVGLCGVAFGGSAPGWCVGAALDGAPAATAHLAADQGGFG